MVSSLALFGNHDGLPLQRVAGITPLFESIRVGGILVVNVLVRVRFLVDLRILPCKRHRHAFPAIDQAVSLDKMRFGTAPASPGNSSAGCEADRVDDQRVPLPVTNRMSDARRLESIRSWMPAAIHIDMPRTGHFRNDQDFGISLDNIQRG